MHRKLSVMSRENVEDEKRNKKNKDSVFFFGLHTLKLTIRRVVKRKTEIKPLFNATAKKKQKKKTNG